MLFSSPLLFSSSSYANANSPAIQDLRPGNIIERVACKSNPEQTYALYLPSNYSPSRSWPLLVAFDPGARGLPPVERFKEAAERYGYIVCGSHNSRNGPLQPSAEAAKAIFTDAIARFSIDDKRVYLTGFSGGARAATALGIWLKGQVTGIIACGAGLPSGVQPASLPFAYYGTAGTEDFNYPEMKQLERALASSGVAHHIETFEGGHDWAPSEVCVRAVEWMELQAMKSDRRARDDSFIDRLLKNAQDSARTSESAGRIYEAYLASISIAADFKGARDVTEFEKKAAVLKDSKAVKQALGKERDQESDQLRRVSELFGLRGRLTSQQMKSALDDTPTGVRVEPKSPDTGLDSETRESIVVELRRSLADLDRKSQAKEPSPERALARRVLNQFRISSFEQSMTLLRMKRYDLAAANLAIDAEVMPDNPRVQYNLACAYALKGDKRRAIESLNKAVQKGFANAAELERNEQLDSIRGEDGFKKIVEALKQKK